MKNIDVNKTYPETTVPYKPWKKEDVEKNFQEIADKCGCEGRPDEGLPYTSKPIMSGRTDLENRLRTLIEKDGVPMNIYLDKH